MKNLIGLCTTALCIFIIAGCATGLSKQAAVNSRSDVFTLNTKNDPVTAGLTELNISASLKTHKEFDCPINQQHSHGTPDYKLVINVDGQSLPITGELKEENLSNSVAGDPEKGNGIRYIFRQKIRLAAGRHRIIVSLLDDGIAVSRDFQLDEKSVNSLVVEPVYNSRSGSLRSSTYTSGDFHEGLRGISLFLNSSLL